MLYALLAILILSIWAVTLVIIGVFMVIPDIYYKYSKLAKIIKKSFNSMDKDEILKICMGSTIFCEYYIELETFLELELDKVYVIAYNHIKKDYPNIKYSQVEGVLSRYFNKDKYMTDSLTELYKYRKKREER